MTTQWVEIGYVAGPHGTRGELKLRLHHQDSLACLQGGEVTLRCPTSSTIQTYALTSFREGGKTWIAGLEGIRNRSDAVGCKGYTLVTEAEVESGDEVLLEALRGVTVIDEQAGTLGKVTGFMFTNIDILVVCNSAGDEVLIPVLENTLKEVRLSENEIVVQTPEGLLEV